MKIIHIKVYKVTLPFRLTFSHSQKTANSVDNIVVELFTGEPGLNGYGEGGPRRYVTGETQDSSALSIKQLCTSNEFPWDLNDLSQIWNFVDPVSREKNHNAALCALEMALLDLLAKKDDKSILHYLPKDHFIREIRYGGALPIAGYDTLTAIYEALLSFDIHDLRLKMGRDFEHNKAALKVIREFVNMGGKLRVDVNGAWDLDMCRRHLPLLESYGVTIFLEQPMLPEDPQWEDLAEMLSTSDIKLMADESVCSMQDMEKAIADGYFDVINVRLSKCGGFYNSLKIIQRIRDARFDYQIGCQLGESGILSAAGRALCAVSSDALYFDGSYDAFLLRENITTEHVTFGHGGKARPVEGPGLGITVNHENLKRFSDRPLTIQRP